MRHTIFILFAGLLLATFSSCEDWLDVRPQTEIKVDDNFKTSQGYKDALTGIYMMMSDPAIYGRELSYGMVDLLGKQITQPYLTGDGAYASFFRFDYETIQAKSMIDAAWNKMYNVLANINTLIEYIDKADKAMFTGVEYNVIRGEAYGLRAFIHFDLLRLFGYSYKAGADKKAIPYETTFSNKTTEFSTVAEVIGKALDDLKIAEDELAADPVMNGDEITDYSNYLRYRFHKFNYYAVKLLQARIHLYKSDYTEAFKAADVIIKQDAFTWVPPGTVTTSTLDNRNLIFWQELIFALYTSDMPTLMESWGTTYTKTIDEFNTVYETAQEGYSYDFRYQYLKLDTGSAYYHIKLNQYSDYVTNYTKRLPIMRISEAYYIAAECKLNQTSPDPNAATGYLNTVRQARNLYNDLQSGLTVEQVQNEIFKEYAKEFVMEGQLFYYYKRLNSTNVRFYTTPVGSDDYVLPIPDAEIEGRLGE